MDSEGEGVILEDNLAGHWFLLRKNHLMFLSFSERRDIEGEGIILEDNPAGHWFFIKKFNSN